ncbi:MAG: MFS transporter [Nocardioidaceae bacterium]
MTRTRDLLRRNVKDRLKYAVGGAARLRVVVLLACVLALEAADTATIGATAVSLERTLHINNTDIGLLVTVSTGIGALATLPIGALTDRINRVNLLAGAILVWSVAMAISGASISYNMLLITRLALGAVVATAGPAVASLTGDFFPAAERGRIYGFILSGELIGAGVGFLVSGDLAAVLSWRYSFWVLSVPGLFLAIAIWRLLPEPARGGQSRLQAGEEEIRSAEQVDADEPAADVAAGGANAQPRDEGKVEKEVQEADIQPHDNLVLRTDPAERPLWWAVKYVLSIRTNRVLIVASALGYFFFSGLRTFAVVYLRDRFAVGQGTASSLLVVLGVGAIVGVLITGRLADWLIDRGHLTARPVIAGLSFLIAAVLFLPGMLTATLLVAAPLFFLAAAGVGGANPPLDAARLDLIHSRLWGRAEAVRTVLRSSFEAIAPLLFGYVSTQFGAHTSGLGHPAGSAGRGGIGLEYTFLIMLVPLAAAGLILLLRARRTYPRDVATAVASEHATAAEDPT